MTSQSKKEIIHQSYFVGIHKKTRRFAEFLHFGEFSFLVTGVNSITLLRQLIE